MFHFMSRNLFILVFSKDHFSYCQHGQGPKYISEQVIFFFTWNSLNIFAPQVDVIETVLEHPRVDYSLTAMPGQIFNNTKPDKRQPFILLTLLMP